MRGLARGHAERHSYWLRLRHTRQVFQPFQDTAFDRYPEVFSFLQNRFGDTAAVNILSFGCSSGEELLTLRRYFPSAFIRGLDIDRRSIRRCRRQPQIAQDRRISVRRAGDVRREKRQGYDAIVAMAVFRHGELARSPSPPTCNPPLQFSRFDEAIRDLEQCLKPDGLLAIDHSNFRLADTSTAGSFETVLRIGESQPWQTPLYGPDNQLLHDIVNDAVVFQKRTLSGPSGGATRCRR